MSELPRGGPLIFVSENIELSELSTEMISLLGLLEQNNTMLRLNQS